jgi:hypothetical protein
MKAPLFLGMGAVLAMFVGCAHGLPAADIAKQDMRGSIRVAQQPRLLVAGPASYVHTSVEAGRSVDLFVVDAVNGDDRDCAQDPAHATTVTGQGRSAGVPKGRELCVASVGSAEVLWHARVDSTPRAIALK